MNKLIILLSMLFFGFTTVIVEVDTPILYKRYYEVVTLYNHGPDLPMPFFFTMIMDTRIPIYLDRALLSCVTFDGDKASQAHQEGIAWTRSRFAHLRITIPDETHGLQLHFLAPSAKRTNRVFTYIPETPRSILEDARLLMEQLLDDQIMAGTPPEQKEP
jgi:hypothetical protein